MFRRIVDLILNKVNKILADWLEPVSSSQLDFSAILGGKIDILHMQIRQKLLDFLPLPVNLVFR